MSGPQIDAAVRIAVAVLLGAILALGIYVVVIL